MTAARVLCVGGLNADHVVEVDTLPYGEGKQVARRARWTGGGIAATAAVAVARLGGHALWCGSVGDDPIGALLVEQLTGAGVHLGDKAVVPGATTAMAAVLVDAEGRRWLGWHAGEGFEGAAPPELPDDTDAVMADFLDVGLSLRAFDLAVRRGRPRVLDMEDPARPGSADLMAAADHVVFSGEGLRRYVDVADPVAALATAAARLPGATAVAVTRGPLGSTWLVDGQAGHVPAPTVVARDTTGCGDVFHGAYALGLAEGRPPLDAARLATAAAALKAEHGNGWSGMPDRDETEHLLQKGWT